MREIMFRAWHIKDKAMLEWDVIMQTAFNRGEYQLLYSAISQNDRNYNLMQYTGLKDQDGVEIFEGDIIDMVWIKTHYRGVVIFDNGEFCFRHKDGITSIGRPYSPCILVRGNIHEHPELLQK